MSAACSALLRNWTKTWMRKATPTPANATKVTVVMTCPSSRLPSGRNMDLVGCYKLSVWHFGLQFDPLEAGLLLSLGEKKADRKSTRLNSSHGSISYAVFCLKKKKNKLYKYNKLLEKIHPNKYI